MGVQPNYQTFSEQCSLNITKPVKKEGENGKKEQSKLGHWAQIKVRGEGGSDGWSKKPKLDRSNFFVASLEALHTSPNNPWSELFKNNFKLGF